ncbi:hypothetical protein GH714_024287 [Hevea brasiliensis]|uniref:MPN domain-containing protein n=1 Tax=Hevea brasiliensis TaxID=3981 RepID=A0A6A6LES8_HEVBR|nr:hypothetical protein GH714_024287 [Hevea brasiliensis]
MYGTVSEEGKVEVNFIYEPPQQGTEEILMLLRDPHEENLVDAIAAGLGMRRVGFIFTQTITQDKKDYTLSNREVLQAAELHAESELKEWVTAVVKLEVNEDGGADVHFEAFQMSDTCIKLFKEKWFETEIGEDMDPKLSKMNKDVVVGGKDVREVDNDFFLAVVKILDHALHNDDGIDASFISLEVIKGNGKQIPHVVKLWVEHYEKDPKPAMVELLTMLFEACGAKFYIKEELLDETDVDDVVVALVNLARKGEVEDYQSSKRKDFKNFKENIVSFWDNLVVECQNGPLFDKSAGVRKASILALQNLYDVDDNVPTLSLFTERFSNRMIELADDIDVSVAVCAIGLVKQLLRHQLLPDDDLGPLYDLLIDDPADIRLAIGELVYDHLIAQKFNSSQSGSRGNDSGSSEVHLGRMLQILREFSTDPILCIYVIDDVWEYMKAMKDWKCIISMLLDENPLVELNDDDAANLVRLLFASVRKAVGERIVPASDNRKQYYNKAQKEIFENNRRDVTIAMMKNYPLLLRKFMADQAKVPSLVEIIVYMNLELYSLKRQEQEALRSCVKAIKFCSTESQGELKDFADNILKNLEDELIAKLRSAMKEAADGDEYSLLVNLKRLYELQLSRAVPIESLYDDFVRNLHNFRNVDDEVASFLLLNMYLHVAWSLQSIVNSETVSKGRLVSLLSKRNILFEELEYFLLTPSEEERANKYANHLVCRVCIILAETWCLFRQTNFSSTKLENLGYCPDSSVLSKFWRLCEQQLNISDETEHEDSSKEYIEETNRDAVMIAAAKLVASDTVTKAHHWHLEEELCRSDDRAFTGKSFQECKDLAARLSGTFMGAARNKHREEILKIVKEGIEYAFIEAPKQLSFLESAVLYFVSKLPTPDVLEILKDVQSRIENVNTDEDPSGWRPYYTFVDNLREKYAKNEDEKEGTAVRRRGRPRKQQNIEGKRLFGEHGSSEEEDSISGSDQEDAREEEKQNEEEEEAPLIHSLKASKLRSFKVSRDENKGQARTGVSKTSGASN